MVAGEHPLGQRDGVRGGVEVELHPAAVAARSHLHRPSEGRGERVLRGGERLGEVGMDLAGETLGLALRPTLGLTRAALRLADGPRPVTGVEGEVSARRVVLAEEDRSAVACSPPGAS